MTFKGSIYAYRKVTVIIVAILVPLIVGGVTICFFFFIRFDIQYKSIGGGYGYCLLDISQDNYIY